MAETANNTATNAANNAADLRRQIRDAVDPDGEQSALLDAIGETRPGGWMRLLGTRAAEQWDHLRLLKRDHDALLDSIQDALEVLVPRGWAPFQMKTDTVQTAVQLVKAGEGDTADAVLSGQWEGDDAWRTKRICDRVRSMGSGARQTDLEALFHERARLLAKAKQHHENGSYEASIPILHAQMEGIVMDVAAGKKFFTKRPARADLADAQQLIAIEACLPALQALFGQNVADTQAAGSLSRHGVAHGRELAYDTRENSAKCWSVLDAIVEWALPLAHQEAERRLAEQQAARAGSQAADDFGRRLDDREFRETRNVLTLLGNSAIGHRRNRGTFRCDLIGGVYTVVDFTKRGLPVEHGTRMSVSDDDSTAWFWRRTISGWVLGYAVAETERGMVEWFYAEAREPDGPPRTDEGWSEPYMRPPDWA